LAFKKESSRFSTPWLYGYAVAVEAELGYAEFVFDLAKLLGIEDGPVFADTIFTYHATSAYTDAATH
jgi:hypothetical protein